MGSLQEVHSRLGLGLWEIFCCFFYWKRGRAVLCLPVLDLHNKKSNSESLVSEHSFIIRFTQTVVGDPSVLLFKTVEMERNQ